MKKLFQKTPGRRGFTLIEFVVVLIILAILATVGSVVLGRGISTYFGGRDITLADWQARVALERMTRDLREVRSPADLTTITATQITFNDLLLNNVTYTLAANTLTRNGIPLADNVSALNLSYLQRNGQTTAAAAAVVYYITAQITVTDVNGATVIYRDSVHPRIFP
ncbi:MAG: PulJ/GspJ family protein [Burkholderiales bacterium]